MMLPNHTYELSAVQILVGLLILAFIMWRTIQGMRRAHHKMTQVRSVLAEVNNALIALQDVGGTVDGLARDLKHVVAEVSANIPSDDERMEWEVLESLGALPYEEARRRENLASDAQAAANEISAFRDYLIDSSSAVRRIYDACESARTAIVYSR